MDYKSKRYRILVGTVLLLGCTSASAPAVAQDSTKSATEKWRPKDGLYAEPGTDLSKRCMDSVEVAVELADKSIGGSEWDCKITKLTEAAPDTVKLDATCTELEDKPYKAIFLLKKINNSTIFYSASVKGKKDPSQPMTYCPEEGQRWYADAKAEKKQKRTD